MKTKLVYVVASSDEDYYMEQAIVSAWSARYYNPDAIITLVCDQDTNVTLQTGFRQQYAKDLFDEVIVQQFPESCTMIERSRVMKTNLRNIIDGDYLFLDTDTIVCKNLSFIDLFSFDLGFVYDQNCLFEDFIIRDTVLHKMKDIYHLDVSLEREYFNGGVSFVKDTPKNHDFFTLWNELWKYSFEHYGDYKDQQPLFKANIEMMYPITAMQGEMNCQILTNVNHLSEAAIIHIYNNLAGTSPSITPFHDPKTYYYVKEKGITKELETLILNAKSSFSSPVFLLTGTQAKTWRSIIPYEHHFDALRSNSCQLIMGIKRHFPVIFSFIEWLSGLIIRIKQRLVK